MSYLCGHKVQFMPEKLIDSDDAACLVKMFPCPACCRATAANFQPELFVNLQKLSADMSAIVLEVVQAYPLLSQLLERDGYSRHGRSLDELHPGGSVSAAQKDSVLRKEFWFAASTEPAHVVALLDLVKCEVSWLEQYLIQADAVHYLDFPAMAGEVCP